MERFIKINGGVAGRIADDNSTMSPSINKETYFSVVASNSVEEHN
jgi:hypothetical protein